MDRLPKLNRLTDRQERDLAIKMAGGPGAGKAAIAENLNKIRAVTNQPGGPLTKKQIDTLARGMAGGGKSADPKQVAKNKAGIRQITGQQKQPNQPSTQKKSALSPKQAPAKAANDNRKPKALKEGHPKVVRLSNGKTFVHKSALQKPPASKPAPGKSAAKDVASRKAALSAPSMPKVSGPVRQKGRERSR